MASNTLTLLSICMCLWTIDSSHGLEVRLEPRDVKRYVGHSLRLTCTVADHRENGPKVNYIWLIPMNNQDNAKIEETSQSSTLTISQLQETDGGDYVCEAEEATVPVDDRVRSKASVRISVFPRGDVLHCSVDSFRCKTGHCISNRYKCDGHPDCPHDGSDEAEEHCGQDPCAGKLECDDGRCLARHLCCREPDLLPPNCTITSTIMCCRQLVHPALLDQDMFYLEMRPNLQQRRTPQPDSTLVMGCIVAVANLVTVAIIVGVRYHLWRSNNNSTSTRAQYHLSRIRSATFRPFGLGSSHPPPSTTDQYQLRSADSLYTRRIPGLRSDLLAPEILLEQRQYQRPYSGVILCPPTHAQPPHYSQLPIPPQGPPPSYHQVVGAPPPPYCSRDDLTTGSVIDGSSLSLLVPLLSNNNNIHNINNNNGDINGNNTSQLTVQHNHNHSIPSTSTSSHPTTTTHVRNK